MDVRDSQDSQHNPPKRRRGRPRTRPPRLLDRSALDGRTREAKTFDHLVAGIYGDLGGRDQLSVIELGLAQAFAGAKVILDNLNMRILGGAEIDSTTVSMHAQAISTMVRSAGKLGTVRRVKPVVDLDTFLASRAKTLESTK